MIEAMALLSFVFVFGLGFAAGYYVRHRISVVRHRRAVDRRL
jgi:hypothetical protein